MEEIRLPIVENDPGGESAAATAELLAERNGGCIVCLPDVPSSVTWLRSFEFVYARRQRDGSLKGIRKATDDEIKSYRVPVWIQDDEVPMCCGEPMHFVGQLDDDALCTERPAGAAMWWHDRGKLLRLHL